MANKYTVAEAKSIIELIVIVNALMEQGYSPVGQLLHVQGDYMQPMCIHPDMAVTCANDSHNVRYHEIVYKCEDCSE